VSGMGCDNELGREVRKGHNTKRFLDRDQIQPRETKADLAALILRHGKIVLLVRLLAVVRVVITMRDMRVIPGVVHYFVQ